jgi:flagellar motor switch protein FliG
MTRSYIANATAGIHAMIMQTESSDERLAVLLGLLGPEVADPVLDRLPENKSQLLRSLVKEVQNAPFDRAELSEILDEFMRFFRFALDHVDDADQSDKDPDGTDVDQVFDNKPKKQFVSSGDPFVDLKRLKPTQIAGALRDESPRTIAVVLNCLEAKKAGESLRYLADEIRGPVFVQLRNPPVAQSPLLERVVRTTVDKGCRLDAEYVADPEEQVVQKMADLLRHVDQQQRNEMLVALSEQDTEMADRIKRMLYLFEDVAKLSDRCMRKLLGEIESTMLYRSLKNASEETVSNVMNNLSKRAQATLTEELEFLTDLKPDEVEEARRGVCEVMAKLDESGDLEMQ